MAASDGTWTHETKPNGMVVSFVTGRDPRPTIKKLSPIWWVYNSDDPTPPSEYMPDKPDWLRTLMWYARNPLHNVAFYVIGVADRDYSMRTKFINKKVYVSVIDAGRVASMPVKLPFFSYEDERITFHLGWQMHGDFTAKLNINNSQIQVM
jgi:hypothetical protein